MLSPEPFHLDSQHWLIAFVVAVAVHTAIFLSYQSNKNSGAEKISQKSIVIRLKKITYPAKVALPPIMQPKVEPLPKSVPDTKPILKSIVKPKPEPKPEPKLAPKPSSIVKPVKVYEARVDPMQYDNIQRDDNNDTLDDFDSGRVDPLLKHSYESQLLAWLERHKKYPNLARRRSQQGTVILKFVINAEGKLLSHKILQASSHTALNTAVIKMIKRSSPMPSVPKELQLNREEFSYTIPIHFKLKK